MQPDLILLVEDNADDEALALRAFRKQQIKNSIVVAHDGEEALDLLFCTDTSFTPKVIFLDLNLPKINGFEVLQRLRAELRTRRIPVVIISSSDEERDKQRSYDFGANSYVRKPVDFKEFVDIVQFLARYWLSINLNAHVNG